MHHTTPVTLKFSSFAPVGIGEMQETEHAVQLPQMHAKALAAFMFNGGAPEGIFGLGNDNPWITAEDRKYIEGQPQAVVGLPI